MSDDKGHADDAADAAADEEARAEKLRALASKAVDIVLENTADGWLMFAYQTDENGDDRWTMMTNQPREVEYMAWGGFKAYEQARDSEEPDWSDDEEESE